MIISELFSRLFVFLIVCYQKVLSPLMGPACRYTPSCSEYALQAIKLHGPFRGGWMGIRRIFRCHPWGGHGHDPVPGSTPKKQEDNTKDPLISTE